MVELRGVKELKAQRKIEGTLVYVGSQEQRGGLNDRHALYGTALHRHDHRRDHHVSDCVRGNGRGHGERGQRRAFR